MAQIKEPVEGQLLYSVPQAARVLGLSTRLLWSFVHQGEIAVRRINTRVLIHRTTLEKFSNRDHSTEVRA